MNDSFSKQLGPTRRQSLLLSVFLVLAVALPRIAFGSERRQSVVNYPRLNRTNNQRKILKYYPAYLEFVLAIGKTMDRKTTKRLRKTYTRLQAKSPGEAARFLKGLRSELDHKIDLTQIDTGSVTTKNRALRRLVKRFLKRWTREADEHLFRAVAQNMIRRNTYQ